MKISFIGTGYVGLVSGVMMSHLGHEVICLDVDQNKIDQLKRLESPIYEPGLTEYIEKYGNSSRLQFVYGYDNSIADSDCLFVTVGTPPKENGDADLSLIFQAVESASNHINVDNCVIVLKSTVPPGTCRQVQKHMLKKGVSIKVVSNPEFLREGNAVQDFLEPDRIVIGADSEYSFKVMREVYKSLINQNVPFVETDLNTSELIKYASNTFLANKIAFINEMADLCEVAGANITALSKGVGLDKRIGADFLRAGPGFGGSCFPKDILALQHFANTTNSECLILNAVIEANRSRSGNMIKKISKALDGTIKDKKIAVLGLTYKSGTDDLRSSPALDLINLLEKEGADIIAFDPKGMVHIEQYCPNLTCAKSIFEAAKDSDAIIIATEWPEFAELDLAEVKKIVKQPNIIDLRNLLQPEEATSLGFKYNSIGR